jgi:hypothetical protein
MPSATLRSLLRDERFAMHSMVVGAAVVSADAHRLHPAAANERHHGIEAS